MDIGSLEINGGPHLMLKAQEYVGVDLAKGFNVNLVSRGEDVALPSNYFDASISSECFEHNPNWRSTLHNMTRMTRRGGLLHLAVQQLVDLSTVRREVTVAWLRL